MKIIILGAGQVGSSVAANLVHEANDITIVDSDPKILNRLSERYDLRTVVGTASYPSVLTQAGADNADMIIAVTNSDESNMIACQIAYTMFHTPTKIARVRNIEYLNHSNLFCQEALPIDVLICPEQIVTDHIQKLINCPGALQVLDFADGKVQMVAIRASYTSKLIDQEIKTLATKVLADIQFKIAMIYRNGQPILPNAHTRIKPDDEIFFIGSKDNMHQLLQTITGKGHAVKNILIAGGGQIGTRLAQVLEHDYQIKVIESNPEKAHLAAETLKKAIVIHGDAADEELLLSENIDMTDVFCALTNADEANILSSMLAKRLGSKKVMSLINRAAYVDLVQSNTIDIAISPQQATIGSLLAYVRRADIVVVHALRRGSAEAIETIVHGTRQSSKVVGRTIGEIELPPLTSIGIVVRDKAILVAHNAMTIEEGDHVILLVSDKKYVPDIECLFQVGVTFL